MADTNYKLQRTKEDAINENRVLESRLRSTEEMLTKAEDDRKTFKSGAENAESGLKMVED
jgi:hypothetical protein